MILIAVGSNLPFCGRPSAEIITGALRAVQKFATILDRSRFYQSPAWPDPADPPFVNAVARIECGLTPEALLAALHAVEAGFGRLRDQANAPRTLDLDLLDHHGEIREASAISTLVLPHRRIAERDFVLAPLAEVAPGWRHPLTGASVARLLEDLGSIAAVPIAGV